MASTQKLAVKVKPNSSQSRLEQQADGSWIAWLKSPPVEGKANKELIALVAKELGVSKSRVSLSGGGKSRLKRLQIN